MNWQPSRKFALELLAIVILLFSTIVATADLGLPRPVLAWLGVAVIVAKALEHRYQQQALDEAHNAPSPQDQQTTEQLRKRITELQQQNAALRRLVSPDAVYPIAPQGETLPAYMKEQDDHE